MRFLSSVQNYKCALSATPTTPWSVVAGYWDDTTALPIDTQYTALSNTSDTIVLSSPSSGKRALDCLTITNLDSRVGTCVFKYNDNGTLIPLYTITLGPNEYGVIDPGGRLWIYDLEGRRRTGGNLAYSGRGLNLNPGLIGADTTKTLTSTTAWAAYLGVMQENASLITVSFRSTTPATGTITYAECGLAYGNPDLGTGATLTMVSAPLNIAAIINSASPKVLPVTGTFLAGMHLYFVIGVQATGAPALRAKAADDLASGITLTKATTQPSTMGAAAFTVDAGTVMEIGWQVVG